MDIRSDLMKTKAGRRFAGFMATFNRGDAHKLRAFISEYTTDEALQSNPVDDWMAHLELIYGSTGGLRAVQILASDEYRVLLLMQAHADGSLHVVEMAVSEDYPHKVAEFIHHPAA